MIDKKLDTVHQDVAKIGERMDKWKAQQSEQLQISTGEDQFGKFKEDLVNLFYVFIQDEFRSSHPIAGSFHLTLTGVHKR